MLGKSTIKAINFTRPIKAIETIVAPIIKVPVSPGKIFAGYLLKYRKAIKAPSILILIIVTSYFPKIIHDIVKEVSAIIPSPDSIPFKPASILVKLDPIEIAIGIQIRYTIPTFGGAAHIKGIPAKNNRNSFSFDESTSKSSAIPIIPTRRITIKTMHNGNVRMSCIHIPEKIPIINPNRIPNPPISATIGFHDLCRSLPTISAFSNFLIILGIDNLVTKKDKIPQIIAIAYNGSCGNNIIIITL